ncbi:MAG: esterase/lipase family protein, partial [Planctomycetaceae bacterium]
MLSKAILATAVLSLLIAGAEAAASDDGLIVSRDEWNRTTTIVVPSEQGRLDWDDVFRGLARAGRFDDQAFSDEFDGRGLDLTKRRSRLAVRALSAAAPDVRMRVVEHPVTTEPALRIRLDRGDARSKVRRLKALIRERFATDDQSYGLRLDEGWDARPADLPLVLLVQGYGDSPESLGGLHGELVEHGFPCATFAYPNDGPLTEAAELLAAELHDFQEEHPDRNIAAVTHSMGGLVVRAVIEDSDLDPGNVSRLIMVCPPNHGSPWAELPGGLECWEYLQEEERDSLGNAFNASVSDGLNEARTDLKPGSRFLHELNARERNPNVHYSLLLGTGSPFTE